VTPGADARPLLEKRRLLLALGFQSVTVPVAASSAAIPVRTCPPMLVKNPPT